MIEPIHLFYIIDNTGRVRAVEVGEYVQWVSDFDSQRARILARHRVGRVNICTVFLLINHNFTGVGPPLLWETTTFGPAPWDMRCWQYATRRQAVVGHAGMVRAVVADRQRSREIMKAYPAKWRKT